MLMVWMKSLLINQLKTIRRILSHKNLYLMERSQRKPIKVCAIHMFPEANPDASSYLVEEVHSHTRLNKLSRRKRNQIDRNQIESKLPLPLVLLSRHILVLLPEGCLSSSARDEPVAIHVSCCTNQFEFEVDRSLIAEPSPKYGNIMRTILLHGRSSTSHMKPRNNSKSLATF